MSNSRIAGRYELQGQLGEGGMGVVWRALDVKTGSPVAIKLMKDMSDPVAVDLFTKEWRALAEISHPNIVEVRDVDVIEENGEKKPFFVMPLLHGTTLADLIANASSRLTLERVIEIATHVCRGLQAAHQRGLVHRDLKPSNILVMEDDSAKIIDFGVVHLAGSKSVTGQKGTFQYMSPEQALMREITPSSDLFSMGIILYEALTGRKPFARTTVQDTIEAVLKFIPPSVSELNPNINQSVSRVVHKCLAKQPIHRFASARDLAEALQKALRNEPLFDSVKIEQRIERAKQAYKSGDEAFASEILAELEAEGHLDPRITVLRTQIEMTAKAKKIRQLLESARARIEQDEIPLALDKIREVLQLDPENSDARAMREAIEKQRSETQIAKWLELAQTHLNNRDFAAARNAAQEVLAINRADARAMDLLEKIGSTEADAKRIREQKEQLYTSALRAYQNGEISSALGKLDRLFSVAQANPSAAIPERDAVYQSFYKEVRSERDSIHGALEDAQRQFREKNFAGAMAVCKDLLAKYPNDGTFQALKIRIEDAERQELSSYTAEISKRLETERDLDRRVNIVREACERYPYEAQFAQQLKLVRERRDLVNSIVVKARQYEERGQYAEAISQWDILRNIHPDYPGIAIELEQCRKKRDQQGRDEERSRLVNEIDGLVKTRSFAKAIEYAASALEEFPGDAELSGLRTLAEQGLERTKESRRLFEEGQRCGAQGDLVQATELLRRSLELDPRAPGLRDAVINVLVERARALGEDHWRDAEPLCQEAIELDANHPAVRVLRSSIADAKRKGFVVQCLTECRSLVAAANFDEAAARVRAAREVYPNDARLEQYEANLQKEINDFLRQEQKRKDQAVLTNNRRLAEQSPDRANLRVVLESSYAIRAQHPDDPEIARTISEIELAVKNAARVEDVNQIFRDQPELADTDGWRATMVQQAPGQAGYRAQQKKGPPRVEKTAAATTTKSTKPAAGQESSFQVFVRQLGVRANDVQRRLVGVARPNGQWSATRLAVAGGVVVLLPVIAYLGLHWPVKARRNVETQPTTMVTITTDPPDSTVTSEGTPIASAAVPAGTTIAVSRLGYKSKQVQIQPDSDGKVSLEPEPFHLSVHTSGGGASAQLDGQNLSDFADGSLEYDLAPDGTVHTFTVSANGKHMFTLIVQSSPGQQPRVTGLDANDLLAIASLGNQATLYGATNLGDAHIGDRSVAINPSGAPFTLSDQNHDVVFGQGENQASASIDISNAPTLVVQSLHAEGRVLITTNADKAVLTVDGSPLPRQNRGWTVSNAPGPHKFTLSADGYEPQSWTMKIQRHGIVNRKIILHAKVAAPALAGLNITGGTPGAEVALDGKKVGELDSSGNLNLPNVVALGKHSVGLSKPGLEPREFEIAVSPSAPGKPLVDAQLSRPLLSSPTGTLAFEASVKGVAIKYRRAGDAQFHEANLSEKVRLQPGQYEILADAPGYQRFSTTVNLAKEDVTVSLNMTSIPDYEFEDPTQISHEGAWVKSKAPGRFVNLKPGRHSENLVFARPGKTLFWDKKVEWYVDNPAHSARVQYSLEGQSGKLTRRLMAGQETSNQKEAKVDAQAAGQKDSLSLHIRVQDRQIRITNDKGVVLDEFTAPAQDFSGGRIGIRSDSLFLVRSNNQ